MLTLCESLSHATTAITLFDMHDHGSILLTCTRVLLLLLPLLIIINISIIIIISILLSLKSGKTMVTSQSAVLEHLAYMYKKPAGRISQFTKGMRQCCQTERFFLLN